MSYYHRDTCRLCDNRNLVKVLSLTPTPPANAFVSQKELNDKQDCFPLDLWFCKNCSHIQLLDVVDPGLLFNDYVYVSGTSPVFVRHFEEYACTVKDYVTLGGDSSVIDIGSNDGTFLKAFKNHGARVLGIDPAVNIAEQATKSGIETIGAFFDSALAKKILTSHGQADVITANNVFAHIDDLADVVKGIKILLKKDGVFVFEVSYLLDLYEKTLFDMIYHEHLDYHSVQPLMYFFEQHDMEIFKVQRVTSHGGSIRCFVQKKGGKKNVDSGIADLVKLEKKSGLYDENTFMVFGEKVQRLGNELRALLMDLKLNGKQIAGFGAPAKTTTLMYHFQISADDVSFIVDDNPKKQGLYTPGLHIPVLSASAIEKFKPDYLLILAWNFAEVILGKNQKFLNDGGHAIIPLPELKVI